MKNELIRLRSIYEEKNNSALRGLDFKIYKGEVVGVVGRFHSGKTLLLEILEGNCVPDRGIRFIRGTMCGWEKVPDNIEVRNLKKNFGLIGQMTVWENIATFRAKGKQSHFLVPNRMRSFIREQLELYGVDVSLGISVDRLSAVQKFAVALIKAKLEGADLIMAETSELEYSVSGFELMHRILGTAKAQGTSVLFSGIDAGWLGALMDRICLINDGQILWEEEIWGKGIPSRAVSEAGKMPITKKKSKKWDEEIHVIGQKFSLSGYRGEFIALIDQEDTLDGLLLNQNLTAELYAKTGKKHTLRIHQIDFSNFGYLVKWMSPKDNLIFGLSDKTSQHGIIKKHLKKYLLQEFVHWSRDERYFDMTDCEFLTIRERIRIAAFRLKLEKPDVILFWHYHMLDQDSRQIVLSVLSELLYEGTLLLGIFTPVECPNSADGYISMTQKGRSGRMTYEEVKPLLKEVENKRFYEVPGRDQ